MAMQIFRFTIHRVGIKKAMVRGEIRKRRLEQAVKSLQRKIKKDVIKGGVPVTLKVWNADDSTEKFSQQYDNKRDFKKLRKPSKWRRELSRKAKYSRSFSPEPKLWFIAVGKRKQVSLVRLAYDPAKKTLLGRKRKRFIGPFPDEQAAQTAIEKIESGQWETMRKVDFSQRRRYKGPMEE